MEWECFPGFYAHGWASHAAGDKWADRSGSRPTGDVEVGELGEPELRRSVQVFSFQEDSERDAPALTCCKKTQTCATMMGNTC